MIQQESNLKKTFFRFVIPSVVAQWVFALYTMVDGMFVAHGVNEMALAAVNLSLPYVTLLFSVSIIFAVGASTIISILFGQEKKEQANHVYSQTLVVVVAISLIMMVAVLANLQGIAYFLGATDATLAYVCTYVGTIAYFSPFFVVVYTFEILIKADGRPKLATIFVAAGAVLNCLLDWLFIMVFNWGVFGAAFATGLSQTIVVVLYLIYFMGENAGLRFRRFHFDSKLLWRTVRLGLPSGFTELSAGTVIFLFNNALIRFVSEDAVISYTIIAYVSSIVVMSITGIAQGVQPLVSFHHGRGDRQSCKTLLKYGLIASMVFSATLFFSTYLGAQGVVAIFISANLADLRTYSAEVFRIFSLSFLLLGPNVIISGYFAAIEQELYAVVIALGRGFVLLVVSMVILITLFGGSGIWWAATLNEVLCLALTLILCHMYRRKASRAKEVHSAF